jgi:hypothetical protein
MNQNIYFLCIIGKRLPKHFLLPEIFENLRFPLHAPNSLGEECRSIKGLLLKRE